MLKRVVILLYIILPSICLYGQCDSVKISSADGRILNYAIFSNINTTLVFPKEAAEKKIYCGAVSLFAMFDPGSGEIYHITVHSYTNPIFIKYAIKYIQRFELSTLHKYLTNGFLVRISFKME